MDGRISFFRSVPIIVILCIPNKAAAYDLDMTDDDCLSESVCFQPSMDGILVDDSYSSGLTYKLIVCNHFPNNSVRSYLLCYCFLFLL